MAEQGTSKELTKVTSIGLFFSVVCAEDVPFIGPDELEANGLFAAASRRMTEVCSFWPHGTIPKDLREPVVSDTPTLLLVGELDPVTPPEWAKKTAKTLRRSRVVVVPGVAHITSLTGCVPRLVEKFIDTTNPDGLDSICVAKEQRPPFVVGMEGPRP